MRFRTWLLLLAVGGACFGWGFLSYRNQLFPYFQIRAAATSLGLVYQVSEAQPRSRQLALVQSLPYVRATFDERGNEAGVVTASSEALPGYNFYNAWQHSAAYLIDMEGRVLHEWSYDFRGRQWHHAELLPDGSVLVVLRDGGVAKLGADSNLIWLHRSRAHHDLWVHDTGEIYVIEGNEALVPEIHPQLPAFFDKITILSPNGIVKEEFSLLETIQRSAYSYLLPSFAQDTFPDEIKSIDVLHANHVEVFDGGKEHLWELYKRGNILVSMKHLNAIAILDGVSKEILWLWGPTNISLQHHPRPLANGNILLFDNGTSRSRAIEIEPRTGRIAWKYENGDAFFSPWGGAVQRLSNGNTLITNSNAGRAFEVTPEGKIVWEFANPIVFNDGNRLNIWRLTRFGESDPGLPQVILSPN